MPWLLFAVALAVSNLGGAARPIAAQGAPGAAALEPVDSREQVAPSLIHRFVRRGGVATAERFRVVAGASESQREADELVTRLVEAGEKAVPSYRDHRYEISVPELPDRASAEAVAARLRAAGVEGALEIVAYGQDTLHAGGPWEIHVLEADPRVILVEVAHAADAAIGLETTRALARRRGAAAAINGGFYRVSGLLAGDPDGVMMEGGRLLSEPDRGRGAVGFAEAGGVTRALFGRLTLDARLEVEGKPPLPVSGIDRERRAAETIVYTPEFARTTLTDPDGVEATAIGGEVTEVRLGGSTPIPDGGFVISFGPEAGASAVRPLDVGDRVRFEPALASKLGDDSAAWAAARSIASAGPLLLFAGERVEDWRNESISNVFALARHPRTAVGARADGTLLFVTVDGRNAERSVGMSLPELTDLMLELGAVAAANLDGGGSTTMVVRDRVVNSPSDSNGERANGDAVLLFPVERRGDER